MKKLTYATTGLTVAAILAPTVVSAATVTVKSGDTLYSIATKNNLPVSELKNLNNLSSDTIKVGQTLLVSKTASDTPATTTKKEYRTVTVSSTLNVRSGPGTNYSITTSLNGGKEVEVLFNTNGWYKISAGGKAGYVYGQYLSAPRYESQETSNTAPIPTTPSTSNSYYKVQLGDTLWSISTKYNITVTTLKSLNNLTTNTVYVGQSLLVSQGSTPTVTQPTQPTQPTSPSTTYKVQAGDTLFSIATKFNMSVDALKAANNLTANTIYVGQILKATPTASVSQRIFIKPAEGILTSGFGPRWSTHHDGIDIAKSGNVEAHAAADGVVTRSYTSDSYGECIFIRHEINGQTYETVYAHMRSGSRAVQVGDQVKVGQFIGWMGSTGHSTGQHLHFEVHKGLWNAQKSNAVDPELYTIGL
ncbi:LysM peptidoglycan-binding domain-containing protein [Priestia megaterium]|uniref:LysM peptidoglycan-binding domain-containing protein n=1 Tax=Priestia megaterium TaxID=1404 RepID=A0A6M6E8U2_PRIMG|nr:LysM peptidoglycan-binding domain-containing protein [Priestia megaterium]QJX80838.1 LysM peptidoglycan-binding domain-containing protein [Priestia megaterium]